MCSYKDSFRLIRKFSSGMGNTKQREHKRRMVKMKWMDVVGFEKSQHFDHWLIAENDKNGNSGLTECESSWVQLQVFQFENFNCVK